MWLYLSWAVAVFSQPGSGEIIADILLHRVSQSKVVNMGHPKFLRLGINKVLSYLILFKCRSAERANV